LTASYLIVAGGGGGGSTGGGGGAGGLLTGSGLTIDTNSIYVVTVGAGGAISGGQGVSGSNSLFSAYATSAVGGGYGGGYGNPTGLSGATGGSGGGGGYCQSSSPSSGGAGTAGQGSAGGTGTVGSAGGGGGANAITGVGGNAAGGTAGNGGNGTASSISGTSTTYAGGGGGESEGGTAGTGGSGGGGRGGLRSGANAVAGTANTGGGGGGGDGLASAAAGGSGVVIISYSGSVQLMAGGTVTVAGGNVIHTFTSSGYLTPIVLVNNSLRFRASANAYLNRTPSNGNKRVFTWSGWIKRGIFGTQSELFVADINSAYAGFHFQFNTNNKLYVYQLSASASEFLLVTTAVYRDPSAWYHVVLAVDTDNATENNRVRLYVNGTEVTAFDSRTNPTTGLDTYVNNSSYINYIGTGKTAIEGFRGYFDGYMADINFIDGQALTPNSFGTSNGLGVWQPIRYGGSYGTNGFYLPFNSGTSSFAGSFNGSSQYLNLTANSSLQFGTGDFTVEGWYYQNGTVSFGNIFSTTLLYTTTGGLRLSTGNSNNTFQVATAGSSLINASVAFSASRWNHFAIVRSSGVTTLYQNGVSVGSASDSNSYTANTFVIGWVDGSGSSAYLLNGLLSNFRVVKGTAVYTSNFIPSTSPLTAITNTSLLTLQNSTIIDNSTNAFSITNNGTVTTGQTYPCSTAIFNDQSPQGNNWTPNNISGASGSTLDYMTDVPTLTSATVANYAVLNPLQFAGTNGSNPSDGNLTVNSNGSANPTKAFSSTIAASTGKFYAEFTISSVNYIQIAAADVSTWVSTYGGGLLYGSGTVSWDLSQFKYYINSTGSTATGITGATNDVLQIAFDADTRKVWFGRNNTWNASGNPSAGTGEIGTVAGTGSLVFVVRSENMTTNCNFGQRPFAYTPPTDFKALNTFNLTTPAIGATASTTANKYFDISLYTGNGSTQSITNAGSFQPDFVWMKSRSPNGYQHVLQDVIRGTGQTKKLYSSLSEEENGANAPFGNLSSFDSNGFSVSIGSTNANQTNASSQTYVGWQWKANGAGVTNTAGSINSTVSSNTATGFSIVTYTGNATSGSTVGHGCQVGGAATAPNMIILKSRSLSTNWYVYNSNLTSASYQMYLNLPNGEDNSVTTAFNSVAPGATTFTLPGTGFGSNNSGATYVAYCFAQVAGYSAFGKYTGNGVPDGTFIFTGFRPKYIMMKSISTESWEIFDTSRSPYNQAVELLEADSGGSENTASTSAIDILSNGFKQRNTRAATNGSGTTYIYMAFAENPFKYSNAR